MPTAIIVMNEENPYSAPKSEALNPVRESLTDAKSIVREWESLRLPYNAILLVAGLLVIWVSSSQLLVDLGGLLIGSLFVGVGANVAYFLGPIWEVYACVFRNKKHYDSRSRLVLFGAGVFFSLCCFFCVVLMAGVG